MLGLSPSLGEKWFRFRPALSRKVGQVSTGVDGLAAVQIKAPLICGDVFAVALPESLERPALRAFFPGPAEST